jgi:hypothetical protein
MAETRRKFDQDFREGTGSRTFSREVSGQPQGVKGAVVGHGGPPHLLVLRLKVVAD